MKWFMLMAFRLDHLLKLCLLLQHAIQLSCWSIHLNIVSVCFVLFFLSFHFDLFLFRFFISMFSSCWKVHCAIYFDRVIVVAVLIVCRKFIIYNLSTHTQLIASDMLLFILSVRFVGCRKLTVYESWNLFLTKFLMSHFIWTKWLIILICFGFSFSLLEISYVLKY